MGEAETRQRLLRNVKKEVKQIMEEAVTRKFVHEESSHIISFCAVVEACVLHGLKRRAAGFLRSNKLAALFLKVGKIFTPAEDLCKKVQELEQLIENNSRQIQSQTSQDSIRKQSRNPNLSPQAIKHLWIRTALTEKVLDKIVLYLVENSSKFYEREALLRDPVDGPILASLLVGPCALEYTKAKTANHFWTDPSADELVQRHRIHSGHCRQDSPTKRPALIQKRQSSGSMDDRPSLCARDYVESLHQNSRATLLFGKNNVLVQPTDDMEAIPGYLSLHQTAELMTLKWTPNQLMNGNMGEFDYEKRWMYLNSITILTDRFMTALLLCRLFALNKNSFFNSVYWDYAMTIRLEEIVYLHCHQQVDSGGTVVLVSQDGIQRPPFRFPKGGHLLQFLTCLETGLLPHGQLDPPLWSQRGKGKVFPKLRKRSPHSSCESFSDKDEDEATDYVFRIIYPGSQEFVGPELMDPSMTMWHPAPRKSSCSSCSQNGSSEGGLPNGCNHDRAPLKLLCETMKYQIISRAFYGWLAYCRHLSTVRTHLSALVNPTIIEPDIPYNSKGGLSAEVWKTFLQDSSAYEEAELLRLVYYGGVDPTLRKEVWPFLLGHYHFTMTPEERKEVDEQVRACYEQTMSEWLGCEAIVRQREKEQHAAALAKCASGASADLRQDSTISTDSSQSCSSEKQGNACSQCDSNSSTQVFGSVDEVDPIESEPKPKDEKPQPKIPNGTFPTCTSSPDSGHPSSRNFSVTSGLSDCSPSTEDASTQENGSKIKPEPTAVTSEVNVDLLTNPSLEDKLKQEPAEQSLLALGTGKGDLIKSSTGTLTPEDETTKPPVKEKIENSGAKVVNRTDAVKSINSQMVSKEKSELNVAETVQSTNSEHSDDKVKSSDIKEKSKQIVESSVISEKITKSLKGIRGSEVVVETQENMKFNDDKDKTAKNIALEMQEPLRALTKEGSLEEAKTADTSLSANAKELIKPEIPNAPQKEHSKNETQPPEPLSESEMSSDPHMDPSEKETKSSQLPSETGMSLEKEIKFPQPIPEAEKANVPDIEHTEREIKLIHSDLEMTITLKTESLEKETKLPQTFTEFKMTTVPEMEPMETQIKGSQSSEMTSYLNMEPLGKERKPPQPHSESEIASTPDKEPSGKTEIKCPQHVSETEATSISHNESSEEKTMPPQSLSESQDIMQSNSSNSDKLDMKSILNWTYDSKRTTVLMKQMNEPVLESCSSILSLSKQSPDTSDDSPSALEMEEIPGALVYMPSADILANVPVTLGPPLALMMPPEKAAVGMPALELCMEAGQNTSPEATESALSEEEPEMESLFPKPDSLAVGDHKNDVASPVSSIGTTYSQELLDLYTLNLHRIDKDVQRCDRNYWYFTTANLEKLRNIMCSYVWQHLDIGYVQGMCDLLAPLLVILDDEAMAFSCFTELMKRMNQNFPHGGAMDTHFANMRSLIQILDSELFELMQQNGDYTHFYFCYRWFLLDFKREMVYDDVFSVWETIWAARTVSSGHFVLFIALALVELYRDIVLENNMDFTDIIKFFNEMAERHDVPQLLVMARDLVHKVQILIENK
ncbi:small G protein signaling modulator 1 isoform X2 [Silurus meridionalis]|uniref:small G protein signaling modulator 1 isoform X2 n=1 Tax=Silurus meridionalis TaxID=175797 RepID=UPI001EEC6990|nr:small G protein signaling modulator 1 isoform X2 [Silurus meridionalis]